MSSYSISNDLYYVYIIEMDYSDRRDYFWLNDPFDLHLWLHCSKHCLMSKDIRISLSGSISRRFLLIHNFNRIGFHKGYVGLLFTQKMKIFFTIPKTMKCEKIPVSPIQDSSFSSMLNSEHLSLSWGVTIAG